MSIPSNAGPARSLPPLVILLSVVSLLNDAASEMITPLLPIVVTATLGGGPLVVGIIEGAAESVSSLLKLYSGWLADRGFGHRRLVIGGYLLSNVARPLIGLAGTWPAVFGLRFLDRAGKGIRTAPRDALIAGAVDAGRRGRAFGFHRAMDHAGAIVGPLLAWPLLAAGLSVEAVFLWSAVPGALVILTLFAALPRQAAPASPPPAAWPRWRGIDARLRGLVLAAAALTLSTVPEAFLVVWVTQHGVDVLWVPLLWSLAHVVKVTVAYAAGVASDGIGRMAVVIAGWGVRVAVLAAIAACDMGGDAGSVTACALFLAHAGALASTEAAERALIGDCAPAAQKATAFGAYHLVCGLLALPGAALFGGLWEVVGASAAFAAASLGTALAALALLLLARRAQTE
jgi:dipeptide/tripeptide permease